VFILFIGLTLVFDRFMPNFRPIVTPRLTDPDRATHQRATESAKLVGGEHAVRTTIRCRYGDFASFEGFSNLVPFPLSYRGRVFLWRNLWEWRMFEYPSQVGDPPRHGTGAPRKKNLAKFCQKTFFQISLRLHFYFDQSDTPNISRT